MVPLETSEAFVEKVLDAVPTGERLGLCLQCGSCTGICPNGFAMNYPPRRMIASIRAHEFEPVVDDDGVWLCMSCFACSSVCPAHIPLTDAVMATLKSERLRRGDVPEELKLALENSRRYGNSLGESPRKRSEWTRDFVVDVPLMAKLKRPVDVLWFVGDYASYHPRVLMATRAVAKILAAINADFGILGPEEKSCGDVQLLAGETGLFELLATKNAKTLDKYEFGRIVTTDPHAYNVLKNEYPGLGYEYRVQHISEYLHERLDEIRPLLKFPLDLKITYHDPCALGRAHDNNVYDQPRELISAIPGVELVEMSHTRANSVCCGGGGGGMWLDGFSWDKTKTRTSEWRIAEALSVSADVMAVACPFETPRFEDAAKNVANGKPLVVKDIAELLAESMFG